MRGGQELTVRIRDLTFDGRGNQILSLTVSEDVRELADALKEKDLVMRIKPKKKRRSKNANDYLWELCTRIGEHQGVPKEEIYRHEIRAVGVYEPFPVRIDALERFIEAWQERGIGWVVDVVDDSFPGYKKVFAYYGTSCYDTTEMSRVIDHTVQDAKALGIPTETPEELSLLLDDWNKQKEKERKAV